MLIDLHLKGVGPADEMSIAFKPRMNFITGDNGLGKSFLLDVAWWTMTRTWPLRRDVRPPVRPDLPDKYSHAVPREDAKKPGISFSYSKVTGQEPYTYKSTFDRGRAEWSVKSGRPPIPGLVIYAQVDGGFSVWDPARNYWKGKDPGRPPAYHFRPHEVWSGDDRGVSEGLIRDWASWQRENGESFKQLTNVLATLSPHATKLVPGPLRRLALDDPKDYPTLETPYGEDTPVVYASAGVRRIIALAYLLVWTWREHAAASKFLRKKPAREIIFLIDEVEAHLHPEWQRRIVPALLEVMEALTGDAEVPVQLLTVTHSPLVLASVEPDFDTTLDAIWLFDLGDGGKVTLDEFPFSRRGGADDWLTSKIFGLYETGSPAAQDALKEARDLLLEEAPAAEAIKSADDALKATLGGTDRFWLRWSAWRDAQLARAEGSS